MPHVRRFACDGTAPGHGRRRADYRPGTFYNILARRYGVAARHKAVIRVVLLTHYEERRLRGGAEIHRTRETARWDALLLFRSTLGNPSVTACTGTCMGRRHLHRHHVGLYLRQ